ncbi:MAG: carbohydrate binding domain-containing protein, partial [Enterobacteriaceae bacterium]|nr:carbohydrate binding domain-containing protein [Enterobacteriaceae bacterium]
ADQVDRWELYRIAQYCDQLVPDGKGGTGTEPRFRCNVYIQDRAEAWTVLRDLAGIFRGMTYWGDNRLYVLADMPRDIWHVYNHASVVEGKFTFSDPSETTRYTSAMVNWSDPKNHYKDTPEVVYDNDLAMRYDFRQMEMTAIGCDRQSEANRRGRWILLTNGAGEVVSFATGLDVPPVGEVIGIAANELAGRIIGGRVSAVNGRNVTLDRIADIKPGDRLFVNLPSGPAQARTVQAVNGKTVTVTTGWSETPEAETNWAVEADDLYIALFRVTGVSDNNDGTYAITGTTYNPDTYPAIDHGTRLDERPISVIPPGVQGPPVNVTVDSYSSVSQGIAITTLRASWEAVTGAVAYEAEWRKDSGNWVSMPRTSSLGFEVPAIYSGRYLVRVRAVNASDVSSVWAASPETILTGKTGAPPKPEGLRTQGIVFGVVLNWDFPAGTGDTLKTEIQSSAAATGTNPLLLADVPYPQKTYQQLGLKFGVTFWYRARLVDKTGNQSAWTGWVSGMPLDNVADYIDNMDEAIRDTDTYKELDKSIQDNVNAIQKEVSDRSAAITKEASDRAAAISKETTARSQALTKEASDRTAAIAAEATTRAQQDQQVAADAANGLLNEQLTREAAISETNLIIQNKTDSLAQSIAQVAAGSGTQFDSLKIWHFNSSGVEGWTGNGTPTVVDNCLRPANHASNPYVVSPASLAVDAASYRFVKLRIRKVGKPAWRGQLRWRDTAAFNDTNMVTLSEPAFDASGVSTIDFSDIKWNTLANVAQIRLDIGATQTASDFFLIDWIAVGRPAPGASTAALEDEATARIAADSAEATARSTLAAQLRGGTDGTDPSKLTSGLIYNERQVRISSEKAIAEDVEALETNFNDNNAAVQQRLDVLTDAQTAQGQTITNINVALKYGNIDGDNLLTNGSFEADFEYWEGRTNADDQSIVNGGAYSGSKVLRFTAKSRPSRLNQKNILLLKGRTYRISAVVKCSSDAVALAGDNTKLAIRNNASDALISSVSFLANGETPPTVWTEKSFDYKLGGTSDIVVQLAITGALSAGTMDVDLVRVMDITDAKAIETKADAGALTTLDGKVKAIGDTVDAQGTALTQVQASIGRRTVFRAVSVGSGGTGGITAAGIFREDGTKAATPARSYMLVVFSTNADGSTTLTRTNYDLYGNAAAASAAFNDAVAALANGTYVAVTTYDEPNTNKTRIYDAIESLGGSREALGTLVAGGAYILLGCKGIGKGNGQELVSPVGGAADARVFTAIEFVNGTMIGLGTGATAIANAAATATSNLSTTVTQQGQTITAQGKSITQLTTDVGGKASQKALNIIDQRLTDAEGSIDGQQTAINGLTTNLGKKADSSVVTEMANTIQGQSERINSIDLKTTRVDLTGLDQNTYYAVTMTIPSGGDITKKPTRIRVARPLLGSYGIKQADGTYKQPGWATHNNGFAASMEWTSIGSGYGANDVDRNIYEYQFKAGWITGGVAPIVNVGQMTNSSNEYIYLRGGSQYDVSAPYGITPVLRTDSFTATSQTINPIAVGAASVVVPTTIRQDTVLNASATTALKSSLKDASADTENMITNGSGESGLEFWEGSPQPAVVTTSPYLGTKCFEYSGTANMLMFQRGLTMLKDRTYRVSLMAKFSSDATVDATTGWGNTKASIRQSESNAYIAEVNFKGSGSSLATAWTEFSFEYTPTADLLVRLAISSLLKAGKMWIDNIRIEDVTDARANATTATAVSQLQTTVKNQGDTLTAQSQSIQSLNTNLGNKAESSALTQTNATVTQQGKDIKANTESVSSLKTRVEGAESGLAQTFESIAQAGLAQFRGFYDQRAEIVSNDTKITASINEVNVTIANEAGAVAQQMNTLQASVGDNAAAIQVTSSALADVSGKLSAQWGVKVQVDAQGRSYIAGIQLGIDGNGASQFLIDADTFGIYNPNAAGGRVLAFAVSGATAYLRAAMIQDLSIDFGKISDTLRSTNFVPGQQGWNLPKSGDAELNNVTIRGTVYANAGEMNNVTINENCTIKGKLLVSQIEGDVGDFLPAESLWYGGTDSAEEVFEAVLAVVKRSSLTPITVCMTANGGVEYPSPDKEGVPAYVLINTALAVRVGTGNTYEVPYPTVQILVDGQQIWGQSKSVNDPLYKLSGLKFTVPQGTGESVIKLVITQRYSKRYLSVRANYNMFCLRSSSIIRRS